MLDNALTDEMLPILLKPFILELPDGLKSNAGYLIASAALAPTKFVVPIPPNDYQYPSYLEMFDRANYHGECIWGW